MTKIIETITTDLAPIGTKFEVKSPEQLSKATEVLSMLNKHLDALIEDREAITKPINQSLKEIRLKYKPTQDLLEARISLLRTEMTRYAQDTEKASQQAADKLSARVGVNLSLENAAKKIEALPTVAPLVETEAGSIQFVTVKKFRLMDITLVPYEFLVVDETKIRKLMLAGTTVPGFDYFEEKSIRNNR